MSLRIAIPTDFSENADKAARFALELFRNRACRFYLVHTYTPSFFRAEYLLHSPGQIGLGDFYKQRVLDQLEAHKGRLQKAANPELHEFMVHAAFNNLDAELNDMARKERLDLIVMGTQGATGAKEVLFGTHAVQVLHKAEVPVLVIPEAAEAGDLQDILFPTDFAPDFNKLDMKVFEGILERPGVTLHVLHAYTGADDAPERQQSREQLQQRLAGTQVKWSEVGDQGVVEAINRFALRQPVQLLVMVRNQHTFLENILVTPVIDLIGFHTRIPFMVIPPVSWA